jgi:hypothetical protein
MTKEEILDKIKKVKALADRGTEGEKANAEKMLKIMMDKYGIKDEDIVSDKVEIYLIDTENQLFIQLLVQICNSVAGHDLKVFNLDRSPKKAKIELSKMGYGDATANVAIECTKAQFIEIKMLFDIYKEDLKEQIDTFMYAYFSKNHLLAQPKEGAENKKATPDELAKAFKAAMMEQGIDRKEVYKMIENK